MAQSDLVDDARTAIEDQVAQLRSQLEDITKSLSDGFDGDDLRKGAESVAKYAQDEVKAVARVVRKNPAGAGTALTLAAAIGFGIGYAVCQLQNDNHRSSNWWDR